MLEEYHQRYTNTVCRESFPPVSCLPLSVGRFKNVPIQMIFKITVLVNKSDYLLLTVSCEFKRRANSFQVKKGRKKHGAKITVRIQYYSVI